MEQPRIPPEITAGRLAEKVLPELVVRNRSLASAVEPQSTEHAWFMGMAEAYNILIGAITGTPLPDE